MGEQKCMITTYIDVYDLPMYVQIIYMIDGTLCITNNHRNISNVYDLSCVPA